MLVTGRHLETASMTIESISVREFVDLLLICTLEILLLTYLLTYLFIYVLIYLFTFQQ